MEIRYRCQCAGIISYGKGAKYLCLKCGSSYREIPALYCVAKGKLAPSPNVGHQVFPEVKGEKDEAL